MTINKEWHRNHRMPRNPTLTQRLQWHREHTKHCACRPIPEGLKKLLGVAKAKDGRKLHPGRGRVKEERLLR